MQLPVVILLQSALDFGKASVKAHCFWSSSLVVFEDHSTRGNLPLQWMSSYFFWRIVIWNLYISLQNVSVHRLMHGVLIWVRRNSCWLACLFADFVLLGKLFAIFCRDCLERYLCVLCVCACVCLLQNYVTLCVCIFDTWLFGGVCVMCFMCVCVCV
jgi:hypothetical protein